MFFLNDDEDGVDNLFVAVFVLPIELSCLHWVGSGVL